MANPVYQQVYESLCKKIVTGEYPVGSLLPSEPYLEKIYHVSRITIRKAVEMLTRNGFVQARQGIGTTVLDFRATQNLNRISSFTQTLTKAGYNATYKKSNIEIITADEKLADILSIQRGEKVAKIHRVFLASGVPIAVIDNYIAYENVKGIEKFAGKYTSLYKLLESEYFISFDIAQDSLSAKSATKELAEELEISVGFPLLCSERKALKSGKCISYDCSFIKSDMYSFNVTLFN